MLEEADRSKERVRQLLAIQIDAQLAMNEGIDAEADTWNDFSYSGDFEAIEA
jgi:hypothetical protein